MRSNRRDEREEEEDEEKTILRIRCSVPLFRRFKKFAVDYEDYADALTAAMDAYLKYVELNPSFVKMHKGRGKYELVTR